MVDDFPSNTRALLARSLHGEELKAFARWLGDERYAPPVIQRHLLRLEQVLPRLAESALSAEHLHAAFTAVGRGVPSRPLVFNAKERACGRFLAATGRLPRAIDQGPHARLCTAYQRQWLELRGLSLSAREHHAMTVTDFLARGISADHDLRAMTIADIERFVALRSRELSRHSLQHVVAHLRSFLRFCLDRGEIDRPLDAIETPRTYRGALPPQALEWSTVQALIESVDLDSRAGRRDHCILHCFTCAPTLCGRALATSTKRRSIAGDPSSSTSARARGSSASMLSTSCAATDGVQTQRASCPIATRWHARSPTHCRRSSGRIRWCSCSPT